MGTTGPHPSRLARNEALFREVNERIREAADRQGDDGHVYEFACECADPACLRLVQLTVAGYERLRAAGAGVVLAPGHVAPSAEAVGALDAGRVAVGRPGPR